MDTITLFFAHASRNKPLLREVRAKLPSYMDAWIDEYEIAPGTDISAALASAIGRHADFFVPFIDGTALDSRWVRDELALAERRNKDAKRVFTIPIILEQSTINRCPQWVRNLKYIALLDYSVNAVDIVAKQLVDAIHQIIAVEFTEEKREKLKKAEADEALSSTMSTVAALIGGAGADSYSVQRIQRTMQLHQSNARLALEVLQKQIPEELAKVNRLLDDIHQEDRSSAKQATGDGSWMASLGNLMALRGNQQAQDFLSACQREIDLWLSQKVSDDEAFVAIARIGEVLWGDRESKLRKARGQQ
jgi:hypothetical protein